MVFQKSIALEVYDLTLNKVQKEKYIDHILTILTSSGYANVITKNNLCDGCQYTVGVFPNEEDNSTLDVEIVEERHYSFLTMLKAIFFVFTNGLKPIRGSSEKDFLNSVLVVSDVAKRDSDVLVQDFDTFQDYLVQSINSSKSDDSGNQ